MVSPYTSHAALKPANEKKPRALFVDVAVYFAFCRLSRRLVDVSRALFVNIL